jgi:hypothetical protein
MSKNYRVNYAQYVHEFVDAQGVTRFAVGVLNPDGSITRPAGKVVREMTGALTETFPALQAMGGWVRRTSAIRQANYLFGERGGLAIIEGAMSGDSHASASTD